MEYGIERAVFIEDYASVCDVYLLAALYLIAAFVDNSASLCDTVFIWKRRFDRVNPGYYKYSYASLKILQIIVFIGGKFDS